MKDNDHGWHRYSTKQRVRTTQFIRDLITRFTTKVSAYRYAPSFASSCPIIACTDRFIKVVLDVMDASKAAIIYQLYSERSGRMM
jgi:hypothetical protein